MESDAPGYMNLIVPENGDIILPYVMTTQLFNSLQRNMKNDLQHLQTDPYRLSTYEIFF